MKRIISLFLFTILLSCSINAQSASFPQSWVGNWKGELQWYKTGEPEPKKVNMELKIQPTGNINIWSWQIIYGSVTEDNRPYKLILKDSSGIHWAIDENNGIMLDQYWVANKFCGAFTVQNNTIVNSYWMEKDELVVEFYSIDAKPAATTGKGTEDSPNVDSYKKGSYQKAVLKRTR